MARQKSKQSERVLDMVRKELAQQPDISSGNLFAMARKVDRSIRTLSLRQFHALYPLQVKRAEKAALRAAKKGSTRAAGRVRAAGEPTPVQRTPTSPNREAIRVLLLEFAGAVAGAESKAEVLKLVGDFDRWIDRVVKATA
jgi:hypothetical protein